MPEYLITEQNCDSIGLGTKGLRTLSIGSMYKLRNHLVANPIVEYQKKLKREIPEIG